MTIPERLVAIREAHGYTRKRLADELDRPYRTITNYETGEREPGHAYIIEISKKFGITTDYILGLTDAPTKSAASVDVTIQESEHIKKYRTLDEYGKGTVDIILDREYTRCTAPKPSGKQERAIHLPKGKRSRGKVTEVDVYDEPAAAGLGNPVDDVVPHHLEQYPTEMVPSKTDFGVLISGNSMEPKIPNGSTVFVQAAPVLDNNEIGIFVLDGKTYCKQLKIDHENHRTILRSLNPDFADIEIHPWVEFRTLGRVLDWYTPRQFDN